MMAGNCTSGATFGEGVPRGENPFSSLSGSDEPRNLSPNTDDKLSIQLLSEDGKLRCGYSSFRGKRASMEDFYDIKMSKIDGKIVCMFGIFDGHGGSRAAEYLKEHLFDNLMKHPQFLTDTKLAISETYKKTDMDFLNAEKDTYRDDGSTASTAVLVGDHLYVANVGDSRTVISKSGKAIALSEDHKPNRTDERKRIESAGGVVMWAGTWRVGGVLAMSRAFGNRMLKQYVVAEPEIQDEVINDEHELLVLASDGLWDVVPNEDAVSIAKKEEEPEAAARKLTETAFTRGSADNITCIVVSFHHDKIGQAEANDQQTESIDTSKTKSDNQQTDTLEKQVNDQRPDDVTGQTEQLPHPEQPVGGEQSDNSTGILTRGRVKYSGCRPFLESSPFFTLQTEHFYGKMMVNTSSTEGHCVLVDNVSEKKDSGYASGGFKSEDGKLSCGFSSFRGKRASMEDFYDVKMSKIDGKTICLFGIFDGHGGSRAAEYLKEHLFENLTKHPQFLTDTKLAISETYKKTDTDFLDIEKDQYRDDGSTASTAVLVGNHLYVANVGDSRTVTSKSGIAIPLSEDHKPNRTDERKRIENAGGIVMWAGTWRVGGVLAMSRAFGDRMLKQFVVAEPEIQDLVLNDEHELLVLASDGLWDVVPNEDAVNIARDEEEVEAAARKLTETAFTRGSADNITCIVVRFHHESNNKNNVKVDQAETKDQQIVKIDNKANDKAEDQHCEKVNPGASNS
ncbi:hypothetical protein V2J09_002100 [Rumex salicifolius]